MFFRKEPVLAPPGSSPRPAPAIPSPLRGTGGERWHTRFLRIPGLVKVAIAIFLIAGFSLVPMSLRWPVRVCVGVFLLFGVAQTIYRLEAEPFRRWWRALPHSAVMMILFIVASLGAKEFFPLSHFPMYSDPKAQSEYLYVRTDSGSGMEPASVGSLCKISAASVKKIYRSRRIAYMAGTGKRREDFTGVDCQAIGQPVLEFLAGRARQFAPTTGEIPHRWELVRVLVTFDPDSGIVETPIVLATLDPPSS